MSKTPRPDAGGPPGAAAAPGRGPFWAMAAIYVGWLTWLAMTAIRHQWA